MDMLNLPTTFEQVKEELMKYDENIKYKHKAKAIMN